MNGIQNLPLVKPDDEEMNPSAVLPYRSERVQANNDNVLSYIPDRHNRVGVYIAPSPVNQEHSYFEIEILDHGDKRCIAVGLVPYGYPLNAQPGWEFNSIAYHADDGRLYKSQGFGTPFGPRCSTGDRMGCGIRFSQGHSQSALVFFTRNGKEIGKCKVKVPPGGFYPAVGLHSEGEEVQLHLDAEFVSEDAMLMAIDHCEEEWRRLHDVRLTGQLLEYVGRGKTIHDVGLAQASCPLSPTMHYYEIEIVDPGESCYIAIGVAKKDYPKHRHPGWNKDSIAYHADDGKIFMGSGIGDAFGPRCHKGDKMGCGIWFPVDYEEQQEEMQGEEEEEGNDDPGNNDSSGFSSDEDEEDWLEQEHIGKAGKHPDDKKAVFVEVFFTRNRKMIGKRKVPVPKGGFYPTVGMLSSCERVKVDLHPCTG